MNTVNFQNLTTESGLPHSVVNAIAQDREGFIWVGTQGGLARWDGYQFRIYRPVPNNERSVPDTYILTLHIDKNGHLWIGTNGGGLAMYDRTTDDFIRIPAGPSDTNNFAIFSICDDDSNGLWLGTSEGLKRVDSQNKISQYHPKNQFDDKLLENTVRAVMRDQNGKVWIGTSKGLAYFDDLEKDFVLTPYAEKKYQTSLIRCIEQTSDGRIWFGTTDSGVLYLDHGVAFALRKTDHTDSNLSNLMINAIKEVSPDTIWILTGNGIVILNNKLMIAKRLHQDPGIPNGLTNDTAISILKDKSGLIWIGSEGGLSRHNANQAALVKVVGNSELANALGDADATSLHSMPDGRIWVGLRHNGIAIIDSTANSVRKIKFLPSRSKSQSDQSSVATIRLDRNGVVYIGTEYGLYKADINGEHFIHLNLPPLNPITPINCITDDGDHLFLGAENGLWMIDARPTAPQRAIRLDGTELFNNEIINSLALRDNRLWIGTRSQGLFRYDLNTHTLISYKKSTPDFSANMTSQLVFDSQGKLWIATYGTGVFVNDNPLADSNFHIHKIEIQDGMPGEMIDSIVEDQSGHIWISTDDGLAVVDPISLKASPIKSDAEGAIFGGYWSNSSDLSSHSEILFGANGGISIITPEFFKEWSYKPPIVVTDIQINGKETPIPHKEQKSYARLNVPQNANSISVEFAALDYNAPKLNHYAYQLVGYDSDWKYTNSSNRIASYTNLSPGTYELKLRGSNSNGVWSDQTQEVPITILPAWYQTWWYQLLKIVLVGIVIYLLVFLRTYYLQKQRHKLERQVKERTSELSQKHQELLTANLHLSDSFETIRQLGDVGRDITAELEPNSVYQSIAKHVKGLLNVSSHAIYLLNETSTALQLAFGYEFDDELPPARIELDEQNSLVASVARNQTDLKIECHPGEDTPYHIPGTQPMYSALFSPLIVANRLLGVMTIQSHKQFEYGDRELLVFRTLCAYGAIALDNASAYQQLASTVDILKDTQQQLVFNEKMASIGTLTAGVAHEINNPVNFAHAGVQLLETEIQKFRQFLLLLAGEGADPEIVDSINDHVGELIKKISIINDGTTRIRELVGNLQNFSRLGEAELKSVSIKESLLSTISLVRVQYENLATIECNFESEALIECWPAQLNQVFMNLIVNGCQAIQQKQKDTDDASPGLIKIQARIVDEWMEIEFEDNGCGIAEEHIGKIFDPFFTTKCVGEGTGLGLSISFGIIEKHRGKITVNSIVGQGTHFTITLPLAMTVL